MLYLLKNKDDITTIFTLAIPVIMENILQAFIGTVDIYFAGSINDNAIAAIGVTNLVINLYLTCLQLLVWEQVLLLLEILEKVKWIRLKKQL